MNIPTEQATETIAGVLAKAAPPVTVAGATIMGYTVPELVQFATLIYLVLMIGHKLIQVCKELFSEPRK